jgi:hypothetical protein
MHPKSAAFGGAALALMLVLSPQAHADEIHWSYSWSNSPAEISSSNNNGAGKIILTDEDLQPAVGGTDVVAANITVASTATSSKTADQFTNTQYTLTMFILDEASNKGGFLTFKGEFNGDVTAKSSNLGNTFLGATSQTIQLGANLYTVNLNTYVAPGPPNSTNVGSFGGHAEAVVSVVHLPEPASLTLFGLGVGLVGLTRRRRLTAR